MTHYIDRNRLANMAESAKSNYQEGIPFPHVVIDDFLDKETFNELAASFPGPDAPIWYAFQSGKENLKLQSREFYDIPEKLQNLILELNGIAFVKFLEKVSGIEGLVPDPHLYGGGLHQTLRGGHLAVHVDYNYHELWNLDRRLNAILYMNESWDEDWGGHLEFWNKEVSESGRRVAPVPNRLVVFGTNQTSWHGHPDPLACPPNRTRKSIALYYYSNGRPDEEKAQSHNTIFRERPGERYRKTSKEILLDFVPPIVTRTVKKLLK
jgi:Rps23 Pro-64 3,4-dihydroxylase Tpa1-like proline 4-hydroxylase